MVHDGSKTYSGKSLVKDYQTIRIVEILKEGRARGLENKNSSNTAVTPSPLRLGYHKYNPLPQRLFLDPPQMNI